MASVSLPSEKGMPCAALPPREMTDDNLGVLPAALVHQVLYLLAQIHLHSKRAD